MNLEEEQASILFLRLVRRWTSTPSGWGCPVRPRCRFTMRWRFTMKYTLYTWGSLWDEGLQLVNGEPLRSLLPLLSKLQSGEACWPRFQILCVFFVVLLLCNQPFIFYLMSWTQTLVCSFFPVFDLFLSKSCHGWPGPGLASDHVYTMNPAKEFVQNHDTHVRWELWKSYGLMFNKRSLMTSMWTCRATFDDFETKHGKTYSNPGEREARLDLYRQNLRFIHSKNRQELAMIGYR